jgi:hypothetical protein
MGYGVWGLGNIREWTNGVVRLGQAGFGLVRKGEVSLGEVRLG